MEIGYFPKFSVKHLKVVKANALTHFSIRYLKSFLISFLSCGFYYTIMKLIMELMLFSVTIYLLFVPSEMSQYVILHPMF